MLMWSYYDRRDKKWSDPWQGVSDPIKDKMMEARLSWLGHVMMRALNAQIRRSERIKDVRGGKCKGRPKKTLGEMIW